MRLLFAMCLLMLAFPAAAPAQRPRASGASARAADEVRRAVERYNAALTSADTAALARIWADDYVFVNASGAVVTKAERLANVASGATSLGSVVSDGGPEIRMHGNVAVCVSRLTIRGQYSGQESTGEYRSVHVWVRDGREWRLLTNQLTRVAN